MTLHDIYEHHGSFVWRTVRRLGVAESDASDAVQDVFLIVHAQLSRFEGRSSMRTWLFTICRSVARERRRRARLAPALFDRELEMDPIDLRADVSRTAEHNQKLALLARLLEQLEPEQRNVFILFELERLTGEEIAEALAIPLGTVYSRLKLARKTFRQALSREEAREGFSRRASGGR